MSDNIKITLRYQPGINDTQADYILDLLNPVLEGAKVHEKHNHPPYKHIYITPRNKGNATK
ncbi:MAG: hypothetical protein J6D02_09275 [Lachnospira sp.]|nr:hypothetical protein [Lachnospira sp.]